MLTTSGSVTLLSLAERVTEAAREVDRCSAVLRSVRKQVQDAEEARDRARQAYRTAQADLLRMASGGMGDEGYS